MSKNIHRNSGQIDNDSATEHLLSTAQMPPRLEVEEMDRIWFTVAQEVKKRQVGQSDSWPVMARLGWAAAAVLMIVAAIGVLTRGSGEWVARVEIAQGDIGCSRNGHETIVAQAGVIKSGDVLKTGAKGFCQLRFPDGSLLALGRSSQLTLEPGRNRNKLVADLDQGQFYADVTWGKFPFRLATPNGVVRVLGTSFNVEVKPADQEGKKDQERTELKNALRRIKKCVVVVTVVRGKVEVGNDGDTRTVSAGGQLTVESGKSTTLSESADVEKAISWFLNRGRVINPAQNRILVPYARESGLWSELWECDMDNGSARRIRSFLGWVENPSWTPAEDLAFVEIGSVLFAHSHQGKAYGGAGNPIVANQLAIVDLSTSKRMDLDGVAQYNPWYYEMAPDAKWLSFLGHTETGTSEQCGIFVTDLDTLDTKLLYPGDLKTQPHWTPDSKTLIVSSGAGYGIRHSLIAIDVLSGIVSNLGISGANAHISPNGTRRAYIGAFEKRGGYTEGIPVSGQLFVANTDGSGSRQLTTILGGGVLMPRWSPDSEKIAFIVRKNSETEGETEFADIGVVSSTSGKVDILATRLRAEGVEQLCWRNDGKGLIIEQIVSYPNQRQFMLVPVDGHGSPQSIDFSRSMRLAPSEQKATDEAIQCVQESFAAYKQANDFTDFQDFENAKRSFERAAELLTDLETRFPDAGISREDVEPYRRSFRERAARPPEVIQREVCLNNLWHIFGAIRDYHEQYGINPASLEELKTWACSGTADVNETNKNKIRAWFTCPADPLSPYLFGSRAGGKACELQCLNHKGWRLFADMADQWPELPSCQPMREKDWEEYQRLKKELQAKGDLKKLEEYEQSLGKRLELTEFKNMLDSIGLELTADRTETLIAMMHQARDAKLTAEENEELYRLSTMLPEERKMTGQEYELRCWETYYARYLKGARSILTAEQLKTFEQYLNLKLAAAEKDAESKPARLPESNDQAPVKLGKSDRVLASPVVMSVSDTVCATWGDKLHGSMIVANNNANGTLMVSAKTGSGWGCGVTFFPDSAAKNSDNSTDASGAKQVVLRVNTPAGTKLRLGLLESGATIVGASSYTGVAGADGEAFRHEGITTMGGWQTCIIPLSELKLLGGYGNQKGNRTMDVQAVQAVEILIPSGQPDVDFEVEWIGLE